MGDGNAMLPARCQRQPPRQHLSARAMAHETRVFRAKYRAIDARTTERPSREPRPSPFGRCPDAQSPLPTARRTAPTPRSAVVMPMRESGQRPESTSDGRNRPQLCQKGPGVGLFLTRGRLSMAWGWPIDSSTAPRAATLRPPARLFVEDADSATAVCERELGALVVTDGRRDVRVPHEPLHLRQV